MSIFCSAHIFHQTTQTESTENKLPGYYDYRSGLKCNRVRANQEKLFSKHIVIRKKHCAHKWPGAITFVTQNTFSQLSVNTGVGDEKVCPYNTMSKCYQTEFVDTKASFFLGFLISDLVDKHFTSVINKLFL